MAVKVVTNLPSWQEIRPGLATFLPASQLYTMASVAESYRKGLFGSLLYTEKWPNRLAR